MFSIRANLQTEIALLVSLMLHVIAFGSWQYRGVLSRLPLLRSFVHAMTSLPEHARPAKPKMQTLTFVELQEPAAPDRRSQQARQFIETEARQVTGEQPKNAEHYSDKSTVAANPNNPTAKTGSAPYLEGKETRFMSTENVPIEPGVPAPPPKPAVIASPARPAPPVPAAIPRPPPAPAKTEPPKEVADEGLKKVKEKKMAMVAQDLPLTQPLPPPAAPPVAAPAPIPAPAAPATGREIATAKSQLIASGAAKRGVAAFNVAESPFGEYDKKIVKAVQSRWYALIQRYGIYERAGTVILHFELHDDGSVHAISREENSAGEILALFCEKAVVDSAPFEALPDTLRALVGKEPREVNFTFYY